jgi:hypothetical protein
LSEDAALAPPLPPLSTGKDKDIHLAALGMVVMGKTQSALVGHAFTQNIGAGDRRLSLLALASGQEATAAVSKETVGLNHIPLEEEAGPLRVHPLSLFSHATEEECRELFVSLRDNAKVSPFWYWGFHRSNGRGQDWVLPRWSCWSSACRYPCRSLTW